MKTTELDNLIKGRRSVRAWQNKPVPEEELLHAIELATYAPNAYSAENGRLSATKTAGCPGQIGHPKLGVGGWGLGGVGLDLV